MGQHEQLSRDGSSPIELIRVGRGLVYEEPAEIYVAKNAMEEARKYALLAYVDLSEAPRMKRLHRARIERMHELANL